MKSLTCIKSAFCLSVLLLVSCTSGESGTNQKEVQIVNKNNDTEEEIPLDGVTACTNTLVLDELAKVIGNINLYEKYIQGTPIAFKNDATLDSLPRSFTLHAADLFLALGVEPTAENLSRCKFKHARAYLGLDSTAKFHLYITPVINACLTPTNSDPFNYGRDVVYKKDDNKYYVADLNSPCPSLCAQTGSVLNSYNPGKITFFKFSQITQ